MEIDTAPRPPAPTPWGRLALFVVLLGPVTLLVLLPIGLGLDRYVVTGSSMDGDRDGGISRGSLAFERVVPVSDLRVGDVITYQPPGAADEDDMVTHRIVAIGAAGVVTRGDAMPTADPWTLRPGQPTMSRVAFVIPWIGWAYLFVLHPQGWVLTLASAAVLLGLTAHRLRRRTPTLRPPTSGSAAEIGAEAGPQAAAQTAAQAVVARSGAVSESGQR